MNKHYFVLLAKYNQMVNEKMEDIIKTLTGEEWSRQFAGYFKSVQGLCSHVYIADFNWLKRLRPIKDFNALRDDCFNTNYTYADLLFSSKEDYFLHRKKLDEIMIHIIDETEDSDYQKKLKYTNSKGEVSERLFGAALMQIFVHEIHNRGMISLYLEMLGRENDFSLILPLDYLLSGAAF